MIKILEKTEAINTPKGVAIGGAYSKSDGKRRLIEVLDEMGKKLEGVTRIYYKSYTGHYQHLNIEDVQYNTSVGDGVNLFFLLGQIDLPKEIQEGTAIYTEEEIYS